MGRTFSMRWLADGSVKLSKHAPKSLHAVVASGLLNQAPLPESLRPRRRASGMPRGFKEVNSTNEYGVEKDQIWESLDPRDKVAGQARQVRIVAVGDAKAVAENIRTSKRTLIALKSFNGKTRKGFKLVTPLPKALPAQADA